MMSRSHKGEGGHSYIPLSNKIGRQLAEASYSRLYNGLWQPDHEWQPNSKKREYGKVQPPATILLICHYKSRKAAKHRPMRWLTVPVGAIARLPSYLASWRGINVKRSIYFRLRPRRQAGRREVAGRGPLQI